tara:strand:- start:21571 stop:22290 length:720 start_codon:yes stop_codon:yes gene_type:complete
MKAYHIFLLLIALTFNWACAQTSGNEATYLESIKIELHRKWPNNRTINLVFHGHSVPTGYFETPNVNTLGSYPYLTLNNVKKIFPFAVLNSITTSIGGEQSEQGAERFGEEVLTHRPDVLFIDYALNDRGIGLERAKKAWKKMIEEAIAYGTKVILMTPTPDLREDILSPNSELANHSGQIRQLAEKYKIGLVDSYMLFQEIAKAEDLKIYMAQSNHINEKGHQVVANAILDFFSLKSK